MDVNVEDRRTGGQAEGLYYWSAIKVIVTALRCLLENNF